LAFRTVNEKAARTVAGVVAITGIVAPRGRRVALIPLAYRRGGRVQSPLAARDLGRRRGSTAEERGRPAEALRAGNGRDHHARLDRLPRRLQHARRRLRS
jgi:hypothetical protein